MCSLFTDAIRLCRYEIARRLVRAGVVDQPAFEAEVLDFLLSPSQPIPATLYSERRKKAPARTQRRAQGAALNALFGMPVDVLNPLVDVTVGPAHATIFSGKQSPWVLLVLDTEGQYARTHSSTHPVR